MNQRGVDTKSRNPCGHRDTDRKTKTNQKPSHQECTQILSPAYSLREHCNDAPRLLFIIESGGSHEADDHDAVKGFLLQVRRIIADLIFACKRKHTAE